MKIIIAVLSALVLLLVSGGVSELDAQQKPKRPPEVIVVVDFGSGVGYADDDVYAPDETDMEEECRLEYQEERNDALDDCDSQECVDSTSGLRQSLRLSTVGHVASMDMR